MPSLLTRALRATRRPLTPDAPSRAQVMGVHGNARVMTDFGPAPVALLRQGDRLRLSDGGTVPVDAITTVKLDAAFLEAHPALRPVRIAAGALGVNIPKEPVLLAPDQTIRIPRAGKPGILAPASVLLGRDGCTPGPVAETVYYTPVSGGSVVLLCEGVELSF